MNAGQSERLNERERWLIEAAYEAGQTSVIDVTEDLRNAPRRPTPPGKETQS